MSLENWGDSLLGLWNVDGSDSLSESSESQSTYVLEKAIRIASCLRDGSITEKLQLAHDLLELAPYAITKLLTDSPETWEFDVVHGRQGSIATAVNAATIDAASTISVEYSLVAIPVAADWKVYDNGSFTGQEVDRGIIFQGLLNRVVWTPNAGEDLNVTVSL